MSDSINALKSCSRHRRHLLTGASALALIAGAGFGQAANASDADTPLIWIEFGAQLERVDDHQQRFAPAFLGALDDVPLASPLSVQTPPRYSNGAEVKISFQPEESDWTFSASMRYGRSNNSKHFHSQTLNPARLEEFCLGTVCFIKDLLLVPDRLNFIESVTSYKEGHTILDFTVGKDVGLGMAGAADTTLNFGVRYAQLSTTGSVNFDEVPDRYFPPNLLKYNEHNHRYDAMAAINRGFRGIGPSLALNGSVPVAGEEGEAQFAVDWGLNAAALFGRQKTSIHRQTETRYYKNYYKYPLHFTSKNTDAHINRIRSIIVPNIGAFAGISARYPNAKISLGYRADVFFGAIDGGMDTRHSTNRSFYGPFASIRIGLGD